MRLLMPRNRFCFPPNLCYDNYQTEAEHAGRNSEVIYVVKVV